jgi:hypothetical protein
MTVCGKRQPVGETRHAKSAWKVRILRASALCLSLFVVACGEHPESLLTGRWREAGWEYEKVAAKPVRGKWIDGIDLPPVTERPVVHHEAEYWDFRPDGRLLITTRGGDTQEARWRLKGRGHVLTLRSPEEGFAIYDVKELTSTNLVLNYDVGMEVRGIARLTFARVASEKALLGALQPIERRAPGSRN